LKIGLGIDTGGTCTDGVLYDLDTKEILASAKTPTTREDLSLGIDNVLALLPARLLAQAETVGLSTTLATNACVEGKGGRSKLIFIGMDKETVERTGKNYGLPMDDTLLYIPCKKTLRGEILEAPDWQQVEAQLAETLQDCQAVGIVELYAKGNGAALEKEVRKITEKLGIPTVCGYEISQEGNVIGRGASALLNARLISVIAEFLQAVKTSMTKRGITAPVRIVRSDGSLMNEEMARIRPIETILSGPAASVIGAAELHQVTDGIMIDMGGTTTDISLIRDSLPVRSEKGISVGGWKIFVNGLYVDTFGLGGDSEVLFASERDITLGSCRVMPLCMAASYYPGILDILRDDLAAKVKRNSWRKNIYVGLKDISNNTSYSDFERQLAGIFYQNPLSLAGLEEKHDISLMPGSLSRLISEGVLIRCGVTPTDAMHVKGDYKGYITEASEAGLAVMAEILGITTEEMAEKIYEKVRRKLYCNVARVMLSHKYPTLKQEEMQAGMLCMIEGLYEQAVCRQTNGAEDFLSLPLTSEVPLLGVGGPTGVFLEEVAALLGTKALLGPHSQVANALGAVVGNVEVCVTMEILPDDDDIHFLINGGGESLSAESLDDAVDLAAQTAERLAIAEALRRGAVKEKLVLRREEHLQEAMSSYGTSIFVAKKVSVFVSNK